jgi:nitrous oxidase accessory protein
MSRNSPTRPGKEHRQFIRRFVLVVALLLVGSARSAQWPPIQEIIDAATPGDLLLLEPGVYAGPLRLEMPLTIDGGDQVIIDGGGKGSVVYLDTDGATLKNLRLRNSGESHNDIDAGVQVRGNFNVIRDLQIEDCLFGIDLQQSEHCVVRRNRISSKPFELGQRGDAVRLWYSFHNRIEENEVVDSRDMVVWYSADNEIRGNRGRNCRYSLHFMYSRYNLVEDNSYYDNAVGIFVMYSDGVVLRNNLIAHAAGPTGVGIGFKETSDLVIEGNQVLYCASGLYIDVSPFQPETVNRFEHNLVAYNGVGARFLNDWHGNEFVSNNFVGNLTQIAVGGGGGAERHLWDGNHWSDFEGFDRDGDGVGDTPHELYSYADRIWQDHVHAQFFKGSPLLEVLDFLERLAPFSQPRRLLADPRPMVHSVLPEAVERAGTDHRARLLDLLQQQSGERMAPAQSSGPNFGREVFDEEEEP